ncbi:MULTISPECIES: outer membrane beta-barrel protein [unclassified Mucilaginibacter]|uniref:outer membrane beta-barrel protein n=2 Tax=Mucilaginibacter TaxID=423349 RepID=UPI002B22D7A3|nr:MULTISPECIES: outer membrane beta-barrel protein [unclassified Mucilaginibacter]MEB0248612.1 outer membrane beta-barrel protein [Mucilaginibacter sp. 5B2]MEB0263788.1 outer membrane beta-barrel protein [Mucilaginibacter sp. 10I4]MEB0278246.1 outer membrane beta-barrel protein [Mucilaginibacter sp. 10B2]MEB0300968.1 outer membrane beta-barrel protein [Mucilaginibacter sp. 5C4]
MLLQYKMIKRAILLSAMVILSQVAAQAQVTPPTWWWGLSGAANFNFYDGTTQTLNSSLMVPTAFHKGFGIRPYGSVLVEYRPAGVWGIMLNVGYDGRGGKFNDVVAPCNCDATLRTNAAYIAVEPSLRLAVPASNLYFFAGPRLAFNIQKSFSYTQVKQPNTNGELSNMRKTLVSGQVGIGYEIPLAAATNPNKISLSPFISYQPYFGQAPRSIESWQITTVRAGIALKFGKGHKKVVEIPAVAIIPVDVTFAIRAPKTVPLKRQVSETLPLLNAVFFDDGANTIPNRYVALNNAQAGTFREEQLQAEQSVTMSGRSARQLNVYHNVLNILGDRMRANPGTTISLTGAPADDGKIMAESIKMYLTGTFGIDGSRITTLARKKPANPSEQPGGNKELVLLRAEDRRVDIASTSPELLMEVGGGMMKPVHINTMQTDPLDSYVILNVDGAKKQFNSWSINATDDRGVTQHFGPFTNDQESVSGITMIGNNPEGNYKITMTGETKNGTIVTKESTVHLIRQDATIQKGFRYSVLFDFDKAIGIASYNKLLTDVVSPLITDGSTVIVHGHTDIIGEEDYNQKLSDSRAQQTQKVLESSLSATGKNNVKFETLGFGEDINHSPFENTLPEERFYNRTVVIDIIPANK